METLKLEAGTCCTKAIELGQEESNGTGEEKNRCGTNWKGNIRTEIVCIDMF